MSCHYNSSEMKDNYKKPKLKKPTATRVRRFEQFLWQELYDEYIRHSERLLNAEIDKINSEYYDEFCKHILPEVEAAQEAITNRYPLYSTTAITVWNRTGDITKDFKKRYAITCPVQEQTEQFG